MSVLLTRRRFLQSAATLVAASRLPRTVRAAPAPASAPNVLFIMVDDMCTDLGCHGDPRARTPHLDALAARGLNFQNAYCQFPWCSPSRTSLLTGLRPDRTGVFNLEKHFRTTVPDVVTLPQLFRGAGYATTRIGKIYHIGNPDGMGTSGLDDPASWDETINPRGCDLELLPKAINLTPSHRGFGSALAFLSDPDHSDADFTDGKIAEEAIRVLQRPHRQPFFLAVGFFRPHCPYLAPSRYYDLHAPEPAPLLPDGYAGTVPPPALTSTLPWPNFHANPEGLARARQGYRAAISFVDAQIGRVVDALDRLGLRDNTTIIFCSDHGSHRADHGLWFKQSLFNQSGRVPLIMVPAGKAFKAGAKVTTPVELLDVYPTLTQISGLQPPKGLDGLSLMPFFTAPEQTRERPAFTQTGRRGFMGRSVRTAQWRYSEWDDGRKGAELYDQSADPNEMHNLAADPAQSSVISELKERLHSIRVA